MALRNLHHALVWAWFMLMTCCSGWSSAIGEQYIGIGYNLLKGNPDGGLAVRGGVDPGLQITRRVLDLSDSRAITSQLRHSCGDVYSVSNFYGAKSYQSKLGVDVNLGGGGIAGLANFMFSLSPRFQRARNETSLEHKVFQDKQHVCNLGRVRFADELSDWLNVSVTDSFASAVCHLPREYQQIDYMNFLDSWGTHMTMEVDVGTRVIERSQTSLAEFVQHVLKTEGGDVSVKGSYMGFAASLGVNIDHFRSSDSYNQSFGSRVEVLEVGTSDMPEPINVHLVSIDNALQSKYWQTKIESLTSRGLCHDNIDTDVMKNNIHRALTEYATYKMVQEPHDPPLIVPLTWPRGTYGLMKPLAGCPGGRVTWHEGYRYQDTSDFFTNNVFSSHLHLAGLWPTDGNIRMDFCMKGDAALSDYDVDWPAGDYCVLKYGNCPTGFQSGYVKWNDENIRNHDSVGGTVPDGEYTSDTKIYFCCRNDGLPAHEIYLPLDKPFFLLRYTRGCQEVHGMGLHEETVQWDESFNYLHLGVSDRLWGAHPLDDGPHRDHRLHFCYYFPASHTSAGSLIG